MKLSLWEFSLLFLVLFSACGKKVAPRPITAEDLNLFQVQNTQAYFIGEDLRITWDPPQIPLDDRLEKMKISQIKIPKLCLDCKIQTEKIVEFHQDIQWIHPEFQNRISLFPSNSEIQIENFVEKSPIAFVVQYDTEKGTSIDSSWIHLIQNRKLPKPQIHIQNIEKLSSSSYLISLKLTPFQEKFLLKGVRLFLEEANTIETIPKSLPIQFDKLYVFEVKQLSLEFYFQDNFKNRSEGTLYRALL